MRGAIVGAVPVTSLHTVGVGENFHPRSYIFASPTTVYEGRNYFSD